MKIIAMLLLMPHLLGMMAFYGIPFLWGLFRSFVVDGSLGIAHYHQLFDNMAFRLAVMNTLKLTLLTVPLLVIFSVAAAWYVHQYLRSGALLIHASVLNYAIPSASVVFLWSIIFGDGGHWNMVLSWGGLLPIRWLSSAWLYAPIVSIYVIKYAAYPILLLLGALQAIPQTYVEAARVEGASRWQIFKRILLPLLRPELLFVALLGLFFNFKLYKEAYVLFGAYPPKAIYLFQHFVNNQFGRLELSSLVSAASVIGMVIALLIYMLFRRNRHAYFPS